MLYVFKKLNQLQCIHIYLFYLFMWKLNMKKSGTSFAEQFELEFVLILTGNLKNYQIVYLEFSKVSYKRLLEIKVCILLMAFLSLFVLVFK